MTEPSQLPSEINGKSSGQNMTADRDLSPLESVGLDLRNTRLEQKLELETISTALKIRVNHLTALEEGRLEALPGRTYAVGFVRSYAAYLGLDAKDYVQRFKDEIAGRHDMVAPPAPSIDIDDQRKMTFGWWVLGFVVLVLVIYGGYQLLQNVNKAAQPATVSDPSGYGVSDTSSAAAPEKTAAAAPAAQPAAAPAAQDQTQPADAQQPDAQAPQTAATSPAADTTAPAAGAAAVDPNHTPVELGQANKGYSRVLLKVVKPAYIKVTGADGRLFLGRNLQPGDSYHVPNIPGVVLSVNDGSAVSITLDGTGVGVLSRGGSAVEGVSLSADALKARFSH